MYTHPAPVPSVPCPCAASHLLPFLQHSRGQTRVPESGWPTAGPAGGAGVRSHGGRPLPRKRPSSPGKDDRFPTVALTRLWRTPQRLILRSICTVEDAAPEAGPAPLARLPRHPPCRVGGRDRRPLMC